MYWHIFIPFALAVACTTTPVTKRQAINFMPDGQMNMMGRQAYQDILKKEKLSKNQRLTAMVRKVGKRIAAASGEASFKWEFNLIDNPEMVNAFCLPGGKVAVYTGILPVAKNEAGLAAIMGHEVAHAILKHGAERVSQSILVKLGVVATALSFRNSKYQGLIAGAMGVGLQFGVMLPYGRRHESEADKVGLGYMAKSGYAPRESVELWKRMAEKGGGAPEIVSTHPDPSRRARDLEREIPKVMSDYDRSQKQPSTPIKA